MNFLSYLINGISLGSVYAIIALGYTMVYGIAKMLNFAHGDVIMVGCYIVFMTMSGQGWGAVPAVVLSIIVCTVLGIVIEKIAYSDWSSDVCSSDLNRDLRPRIYLVPVIRCDRVCSPDHCASCEAFGNFGQTGS